MESQSAAAGGGSANTATKDYQQQRQEQAFFTNFNDYWVSVSAVRHFGKHANFVEFSMLTEDIG
jgi:hypothetical protein